MTKFAINSCNFKRLNKIVVDEMSNVYYRDEEDNYVAKSDVQFVSEEELKLLRVCKEV